jgi:hypothetical protein
MYAYRKQTVERLTRSRITYPKERKRFMEANKLYDYAIKLRQDELKKDGSLREKYNMAAAGLDGALQVLEKMLLYPKYNLELSDIPRKTRICDSSLYVVALRAKRYVAPEKLPDIFRLLWSDICDTDTQAECKQHLLRELVGWIHMYSEEFPLVRLVWNEIQETI